MMMIDLPEDLACTEIFSRLPTKLVGKLRCLSKTCRFLLSSSQFINLHLTRKPHQQHLIFLSRFDRSQLHSNYTCLSPIQLPNNVQYYDVHGSCNGLVMLEEYWSDDIYLMNPITKQHIKVPDCKYDYYSSKRYGFGHDASTDAYKIVSVSVKPAQSVQVFSLKTGVWKEVVIHNHLLDQDYEIGWSSGGFLNGAIHWLFTFKQTNTYKILAFNLAAEVFHQIPCPVVLDTNSPGTRLFILRGCLSVVVNKYYTLETWMMRGYGRVQSWTKYNVVTNTPCCFKIVHSFLDGDDDEFVLAFRRFGFV